MITVDITVNDEGKVTDVVMDGHANHGEYGHDIVCAGASARFAPKRLDSESRPFFVELTPFLDAKNCKFNFNIGIHLTYNLI